MARKWDKEKKNAYAREWRRKHRVNDKPVVYRYIGKYDRIIKYVGIVH